MEHASKPVDLPREDITIPPGGLSTATLVLTGIGVVALAASIFMGMKDPGQFWHSYLTAVMFFLSIALGGLFFVLLQFATRSGWSVVVRRLAEHVMGTLPLIAVLVLPIALLGTHELYHWSHIDAVEKDHLLQGKAPFLNSTFFTIRVIVYTVSWALMGWWFRRRSISQDKAGDPGITRRLQSLSAPALIWFGLTLTFAAFDLLMSLDPHWYSTIFGIYFFAGSTISILATVILIVLWNHRAGRLVSTVNFEHLQDLGKLLFGFVVFWAYIGFSQFMLIWYSNIPEETLWYKHRLEHGWSDVTLFLVVGHFVIPFFFLLFKDVKRNRLTLVLASFWLLAMHYVDLYWLIFPNHGGFHPSLLDALCLIAVGGLFLGALANLMKEPNLVPVKDPRLAESLSFENI